MPVEFRVKYDRLADALYIKLRDGKIVESDEVAPGIIVDLDENNEVVGIEVLQASKRRLDLLKLPIDIREVEQLAEEILDYVERVLASGLYRHY